MFKRITSCITLVIFTAIITITAKNNSYHEFDDPNVIFYNVDNYRPNFIDDIYQDLKSKNIKAANSDMGLNYYSCTTINEENRKNIKQSVANIATLCEGKMSYLWGGKPINLGRLPIKMDCSGFVMYVYWVGTTKRSTKLNSTLAICNNFERVSEPEIGDLGLLFNEGTYYLDIKGNKFYTIDAAKLSNNSILKDKEKEINSLESQLNSLNPEDPTYPEKSKEIQNKIDRIGNIKKNANDGIKCVTNHVGVLVDIDEDGNYIWAHLSSEHNCVAVEKYPNFKYYYRINVEDL